MIDAQGKVVAPGFIDMLGQSELTILVESAFAFEDFQGITTEITGEGDSIAPLNEAMIAADRGGFSHYKCKPDWRTFREYFARLERQGMGINLASYVGATQVRRMVLGDVNRAPTAAELERMKTLVREAMQQGAVGVSTALQYAPAPYAKTEELIALAAEAAKFRRHLCDAYAQRRRRDDEALDEAFRIGREAKIPVEIWHLKAAGKPNWSRMPEIVARIEAARTSGVDVACGHLCVPGVVQQLLGLYSAVGARWRRGEDGGAVKRSGDARAHSQGDVTADSNWDNEWQEIPGRKRFW